MQQMYMLGRFNIISSKLTESLAHQQGFFVCGYCKNLYIRIINETNDFRL